MVKPSQNTQNEADGAKDVAKGKKKSRKDVFSGSASVFSSGFFPSSFFSFLSGIRPGFLSSFFSGSSFGFPARFPSGHLFKFFFDPMTRGCSGFFFSSPVNSFPGFPSGFPSRTVRARLAFSFRSGLRSMPTTRISGRSSEIIPLLFTCSCWMTPFRFFSRFFFFLPALFFRGEGGT